MFSELVCTICRDICAWNLSCPVSPVGSPLLGPRSPQHINGRLSPSPISSPRTASGASTPLTGGNGAIPYNQPNHFAYIHEGSTNMPRSSNNHCNIGSTHHNSSLNLFQGMQQVSPILSKLVPSETEVPHIQYRRRPHRGFWEGCDRNAISADHVSHQLSRDHAKLKPSVKLSPGSIQRRTDAI